MSGNKLNQDKPSKGERLIQMVIFPFHFKLNLLKCIKAKKEASTETSAVTQLLPPFRMMPAPFGTYREVAQLLLSKREQTIF